MHESGCGVATTDPLKTSRRWVALLVVFLSLVCDGIELGLMPVASLSVTQSLMGSAYDSVQGGRWFAWYTASLLLGAAVGGIVLGWLGDWIGRTKALAISVLFYSLFAGLGAWVQTQEQMLILRFLVGLGVGGVWPNGMTLVAELWPGTSKAKIAGVMSAGLNAGILLLSQAVRIWPVTPSSWRWLFLSATVPVVLGILAWHVVPESTAWLSNRHGQPKGSKSPVGNLWSPAIRPMAIAGIVLSSIPMVGAWAASKWMIPWADSVAGAQSPGYKALVQGAWAMGAVAGSFAGAQLAVRLGRRNSYALISLCAAATTFGLFQGSAPLRPEFLAIVAGQGFFSTLFFGWLAVYLPELYPVEVRAAGSGTAYNFGRFATAIGVLAAGSLFSWLGGDYPRVGSLSASLYALGLIACLLIPSTSRNETTG